MRKYSRTARAAAFAVGAGTVVALLATPAALAAPRLVTTTVVKIAGEAANPLVPAWFDVAFSLIPVIVVVTMVIGLVSIARNYRRLTTLESLGWSAFVVFAPVLGTVVWLTSGRRVAADGASHE